LAIALLMLLAAVPPALAQTSPLEAKVTVVPPAGGPTPTGQIVVSLDDRPLLSVPLGSGLLSVTALTPLAGAAVSLLGRHVEISYSGDANYEPSAGFSVIFPTRTIITIAANARDTTAPVVEVTSPGDGVQYARGEAVAAIYSCKDPGSRSAVDLCEGPVPSGEPVSTLSTGAFSFTVRSADAFGNTATKTVRYEVKGPASAPPPAPPPPGAAPPAPPPPGAPPPAPPPPGAAAPAPPPPGAAPPAPPPPPAGAPASAIIPAVVPAAAARAAAATRERRARTHGARKVAIAQTAQQPADERAAARPVRQEYAPYDPRSEPVKTVGILVAAFTLLQLAGGGAGLAGARGGGGVAGGAGAGDSRGADSDSTQSGGPSPSFDYESVDVEFLSAGLGAVALGDRSRTWSWPGTRIIDTLGASIPPRLARRSPLLARLAADGTYLRAILGAVSLLAPLAGIALGILALTDTGGEAIPPAATLTIAIAVLGVFDAASGLFAVVIFTVGVLALGGIDSAAHARLVLGLSALWAVVPVLAGAARPLRREPTRGLEQTWDRAADFVIASLIGAWAVQKIVLALPGLAGVTLPIADHANTAAVCVLAALVVRLGLETIAAHLYPRRLDATEPAELPEPGALQRLGASALRTMIFLFFAYIVVGSSWQLWVGAALFVIPQVLGVYEERFPNSPGLYRALPKGLVELVLMLFVATAVGALLISTMNEKAETFLANSFVLLSLPGFLLSLVNLFGRDGEERPVGWGKRIAGIGVLVAGILLVLGLLL
jgi:hypothetical protein